MNDNNPHIDNGGRFLLRPSTAVPPGDAQRTEPGYRPEPNCDPTGRDNPFGKVDPGLRQAGLLPGLIEMAERLVGELDESLIRLIEREGRLVGDPAVISPEESTPTSVSGDLGRLERALRQQGYLCQSLRDHNERMTSYLG